MLIVIKWSDVHNIIITHYNIHNVCQVRDTHELSASIYESLGKVISSKFISRSKCYATQVSGKFAFPFIKEYFNTVFSI